MKKSDAASKDLMEAILRLESAEEAQRFFDDLCTPTELLAMADRWRVAKLLAEGLPYREIHERTGVSTATVTRVARALTYGEEGYRTLLGRVGQAGRGADKQLNGKRKGGAHA